MKAQSTQEILTFVVIAAAVMIILLVIADNSHANITDTSNKISNEFNKDKMEAITGSDTCFGVDAFGTLSVKNIGFDYKQSMKKDEKAYFIFTIPVKPISSLESQLSSTKISCTSDGNQCNFADHTIAFDLFTLSRTGRVFVDIFTKKQNDGERIYVSAWQSQGLEETQEYDVSVDKLIEQKSYYYMTTFGVRSC